MRILKHKLTAGNTTDLTSVARCHHICVSIFHSVIDPETRHLESDLKESLVSAGFKL